MIKVKLLNKSAKVPTKATEGSAGYDIYSTVDALIIPGTSAKINTGIALQIPTGNVGLLTHRSSLGFRLDTISSFGIIDSDYRGEVKVKLLNLGSDGVQIKKGDRVAQLVVVPIWSQQNLIVTDELSETQRGEGGFGSTGV